MKIIFDSNCFDYENFCPIHKLNTLEARRMELCKSFYRKKLNESNCLHYLLSLLCVDATRYCIRQNLHN